eukprot:1156790-Pelagomonas_calceolata.AAC.3
MTACTLSDLTSCPFDQDAYAYMHQPHAGTWAHLSCVDVNSEVSSVPHQVGVANVVLWHAAPQNDHPSFVRCSLHSQVIDEPHVLYDVTPKSEHCVTHA